MARRKFTPEFKRSAVQLIQQQGYSVPETAKSLGVDPTSVRGWLAKFGPEMVGGAGGPAGSDGALRTENARLRKENARLLMEREILKKAAAFFAKEQP